MKSHTGKTIWFTGLPGSGKSTLSSALKSILEARGISVVLLDGDMLRSGLNRDLGFSPLDRAENIRRAGEVAKLATDKGHTVIAAFITPLESLRKAVRGMFEPGRFVEIFLNCPLDVCEERDPKGQYRRARLGEIPSFTGVSAPFEHPCCSDLEVLTGSQSIGESMDCIVSFLEDRFSDLASQRFRGAAAPASQVRRRVVVIGLDGVPPSLVFGDEGKHLTNLRALMDHGIWGPLRSTDPPISVPAWTTITSGRDPGELGVYGFRNRTSHDYSDMVTVNASHVQVPQVWHYLEELGGQSILIGIPQTYPPRPHHGITIAGFPVPDDPRQYVYPQELIEELPRIAGGEYVPDVKDFRTDDKGRLLADIYTMIECRFRVACDLVIHKPWDFFMMVEIAPDRLHHGFWRYSHPDHRLYEPDSRFEHAIRDCYGYLDSCIGSFLALLDDDTTVLVMSDHGARTLEGGVCINEWLIRNGLLSLKAEPDRETQVTTDMIDWPRTKAWGDGGYYARIFLNVKGREPEGTIEPADYESFREELAQLIKGIPDENGAAMATRTLKPEELYRRCNNVPPDLIVYFDDLARRSIGTVGHNSMYLAGSDTGPDDANHDPQGILIAARLSDLRSGVRKGVCIENASCLDITPTILQEFGLLPPADLAGKPIQFDGDRIPAQRVPARSPDLRPPTHKDLCEPETGFTAEEEEIVKKRLMDLGYI